jgi:hypothetical protein
MPAAPAAVDQQDRDGEHHYDKQDVGGIKELHRVSFSVCRTSPESRKLYDT